jgi:hypothetical protein
VFYVCLGLEEKNILSIALASIALVFVFLIPFTFAASPSPVHYVDGKFILKKKDLLLSTGYLG